MKLYKSRFLEIIITILIGLAILFSAAKNYESVGFGMTYVTIPLFISSVLFILYFLTSYKRISIYNVDFFSFFIVLIAGTSILWTKAVEVWANNFLWYFVCFISFVVTRVTIRNYFLLRIIMFFTFLGVFYTLFNMSLAENVYGVVSERYSIENINTNYTAYSLAAYVFILNIFYLYRVFTNKIVVILINIIVFIAIYLLQTRGAIISVALMWLWFLLYNDKLKKLFHIYLITMILSTILITTSYLNVILRHIEGWFFENRVTGDLSGRLPLWNEAYEYIFNNIILGIGIGSFSEINSEKIAVHNMFLGYWLDIGLLGFLCVICLILSIFLFKNKFYSSGKEFIVFGAFVSFVVPIFLTGRWELAPILWILLALTFNILRLKTDE